MKRLTAAPSHANGPYTDLLRRKLVMNGPLLILLIAVNILASVKNSLK